MIVGRRGRGRKEGKERKEGKLGKVNEGRKRKGGDRKGNEVRSTHRKRGWIWCGMNQNAKLCALHIRPTSSSHQIGLLRRSRHAQHNSIGI